MSHAYYVNHAHAPLDPKYLFLLFGNFYRIKKLSVLPESYIVKTRQKEAENCKFKVNISLRYQILTYRGWSGARTSHGGQDIRHVLRLVAIVVVLPTIHRFKKYFCNFDDLSGPAEKIVVYHFWDFRTLEEFLFEISSVWLTRHCLYWEGIYPTYNIYRLTHVWFIRLF
jgi:hypothetical protein